MISLMRSIRSNHTYIIYVWYITATGIPVAVIICQRGEAYKLCGWAILAKEKKERKNVKKGVDKWGVVWYSNKAVAEVTTLAEKRQRKAEYRTDRWSKTFEKRC